MERLHQLVRETPKVALTKVVLSIDGQTIYSPVHFTKKGFSSEVVDHLLDRTVSTIFDMEGNFLREFRGVKGMTLLDFIASSFGVTSGKLALSKRVDHLVEQLVAGGYINRKG